jgi:hypothetical protein
MKGEAVMTKYEAARESGQRDGRRSPGGPFAPLEERVRTEPRNR